MTHLYASMIRKGRTTTGTVKVYAGRKQRLLIVLPDGTRLSLRGTNRRRFINRCHDVIEAGYMPPEHRATTDGGPVGEESARVDVGGDADV